MEENVGRCDEQPFVPDKPAVNMFFDSESAAYAFYNSYAGRKGFSVRTRTSRKDETGRLVYRKFVCSKEGFRQSDRRGAKTKIERAHTRTGCEAFMSIKVIKETGMWVVYQCKEEHNHPLVEDQVAYMLPSQRSMSESQSIEIDMAEDSVDLDKGPGAVESYSAEGDLGPCEGEAILEPHVGMEFASEESAKAFYDEYARRTGFIMRLMSCHRSEVDGRIIARRLGCNKEGYCLKAKRNLESVGKSRPSTREGCKAMLLVRINKSGIWVVTKFVKDHNHPLVIGPREGRPSMDLKDRKINELTAELRNKKRLCALYQDQLNAIMKEVEEHSNQLSKKARFIVNNLKEFEPERELSYCRPHQLDGGQSNRRTR